jgi:hypothetical protein
MVRAFSSEDFYWLVKRIGVDECLPLYELASEKQLEYVLDLEVWQRDRLETTALAAWFDRLQMADPVRFVRWLLSEGEAAGSLYFFQCVDLVIKSEEEDIELPQGFVSIDGSFYFKVRDPEQREFIEGTLRAMAAEDFRGYQDFLLKLAGLLPAEMEEEMYRLRNMRIAEHGFLPFEEALSVYAPLDSDALGVDKVEDASDKILDDEMESLIPVSPLRHSRQNMLTETVSRTSDPLFLDRLRLEFAGLCNQIISAEGMMIDDIDQLTATCRKAGAHVNLGLESLCGKEISSAERMLKAHSLISLFRVGYGLVLKLKWETERWLKRSWFLKRGLNTGFWGEDWGGLLVGLLKKRPQFYTGSRLKEDYKDFEWLSELGDGLKTLRQVMVIDGLLDELDTLFPLDEEAARSVKLTYHPLLFNLWARRLQGLETSFAALSPREAKDLFRRLRVGETGPPYKMRRFQDTFSQELMSYATVADQEAASILQETLSRLWHDFVKEYENIPLEALADRYSKYIWVGATGETDGS